MIDYDKLIKWAPLLDDLKNGIVSDWYGNLPKNIDVSRSIRKWTPILDKLNIIGDEKRTKIAVYAEHHQILETNNGMDSNTILPISIRILSKLDNFEIVDYPSMVETFQVSIAINREEINDIDVISRMENVLVEELVSKLRGKKVLVYMVVSSLSMISEATFTPKMIMSSRIKIID